MKEYLTNRQISFIVFGIIVGYGIMPLTKNIVEKTGTGAWFGLLIASAIAVFFTYIITYLGYVHENKTIDEYSEILTGKYISFIFIGIYIIYFFMAFTVVTRIVSELIKLTMLIETPTWALSLLILFVSYYAVIKGLGNIARICEIYGIIIIFSLLITILSLFSQGKLINLKPFFVLEDIKHEISSAYHTTNYLLPSRISDFGIGVFVFCLDIYSGTFEHLFSQNDRAWCNRNVCKRVWCIAFTDFQPSGMEQVVSY